MLCFFFFTTNDIALFAIFPNQKVDNIFLLIIFIINLTFPYLLFPNFKNYSSNEFKLSTTGVYDNSFNSLF